MKLIYAGTFDPPTLGHADLIQRAAKLAGSDGELAIVISRNIEKKTVFTEEERLTMLLKLCAGYANIRVTAQSGMIAPYAEEQGYDALVRGLRNMQDFGYESNMAYYNHFLGQNLDTIFLIAKPEYREISSSGVRELIRFGVDFRGLLPEAIRDYAWNVIQNRRDE